METAQASEGCDCGCPTIHLTVDRAMAPARIKHEPVPVEAYVEDATGQHHEILLHAVNGYLRELELVTYADEPATSWPDVSNLNLIVYDEPTWSDGT